MQPAAEIAAAAAAEHHSSGYSSEGCHSWARDYYLVVGHCQWDVQPNHCLERS